MEGVIVAVIVKVFMAEFMEFMVVVTSGAGTSPLADVTSTLGGGGVCRPGETSRVRAEEGLEATCASVKARGAVTDEDPCSAEAAACTQGC